MITDLDIPDMDSLELVRKARERSPDLNVVLYSCSSSEQAMQLVFDPKVSDVSDVPRKPCTFGEMLRIVKNATGRTFLLE